MPGLLRDDFTDEYEDEDYYDDDCYSDDEDDYAWEQGIVYIQKLYIAFEAKAVDCWRAGPVNWSLNSD